MTGGYFRLLCKKYNEKAMNSSAMTSVTPATRRTVR